MNWFIPGKPKDWENAQAPSLQASNHLFFYKKSRCLAPTGEAFLVEEKEFKLRKARKKKEERTIGTT